MLAELLEDVLKQLERNCQLAAQEMGTSQGHGGTSCATRCALADWPCVCVCVFCAGGAVESHACHLHPFFLSGAVGRISSSWHLVGTFFCMDKSTGGPVFGEELGCHQQADKEFDEGCLPFRLSGPGGSRCSTASAGFRTRLRANGDLGFGEDGIGRFPTCPTESGAVKRLHSRC